MNRYNSRAIQRPGIQLTDNIQSGGSCSVNYYMYYEVAQYPIQQFLDNLTTRTKTAPFTNVYSNLLRSILV